MFVAKGSCARAPDTTNATCKYSIVVQMASAQLERPAYILRDRRQVSAHCEKVGRWHFLRPACALITFSMYPHVCSTAAVSIIIRPRPPPVCVDLSNFCYLPTRLLTVCRSFLILILSPDFCNQVFALALDPPAAIFLLPPPSPIKEIQVENQPDNDLGWS